MQRFNGDLVWDYPYRLEMIESLFPIVFFVSVVGVLAWVTLTEAEGWPFSAYPMFSRRLNMKEVEVYRLALETRDGRTIWWRSGNYRTPEFIGLKLKQLQELNTKRNPAAAAAAAAERHACLAEVLRLIEHEEGGTKDYSAFHIVRRTAAIKDPEGVIANDQFIARIPISNIRKIAGDTLR